MNLTEWKLLFSVYAEAWFEDAHEKVVNSEKRED